MADEAERGNGGELDEWLLAAGRGDRRALARLYERTAARLFPIALRMLGDRAAAEDALQDAFVLMWRKAAQFEPGRGRAMGWMIGVVRNCAIDRLRAEARGPRREIAWSDAADGLRESRGGDAADDRLMSAALAACLERLQENQRRAIILAYHYGMTHEELAHRLGSPLGTVKSWLRRGLLQLRDCLEP